MLGSLQQPINYSTGKPLTENQQMHIARISEACELLRSYMHAAEGTNDPGEHQEHQWQTRRMGIAATHLEIAEMFAVKEALA